jgi:uncharacterized protein
VPEDASEVFSLAWERAFRALLWRRRPEHLQAELTAAAAKVAAIAERPSLEQACAFVYADERRQVIERLLLRRFGPVASSWSTTRRRRHAQLAELLEHSIPIAPIDDDPDLHCDAALGGLARWLRAMGYDARFWPDIDDRDLLAHVLGSTAIMLTTDGRLMAQGPVAQGLVAALLVSVTLDKRGQAELVAKCLELALRPTRCMACGGELAGVAKESVRDRIPPKTFPWLNDYFICRLCDRLYWEGTHWPRIRQQLARLAEPPPSR